LDSDSSDFLFYVSAPFSVEVLNVYQWYKGLPSLVVALDERVKGYAIDIIDGGFVIEEVNNKHVTLDRFKIPSVSFKGYDWFGDYYRALFLAFQEYTNRTYNVGLRIKFVSDRDRTSFLFNYIGYGVSFIKLLDIFYGTGLSNNEIARIAYRGEHVYYGRFPEFSRIFGSVYGGAKIFDPRNKTVSRLDVFDKFDPCFLIVDLGRVDLDVDFALNDRDEMEKALRMIHNIVEYSDLNYKYLGFSIFETDWDKIDIASFLGKISELEISLSNRIKYTLLCNDCFKGWLKTGCEFESLCKYLDLQGELLMDCLILNTLSEKLSIIDKVEGVCGFIPLISFNRIAIVGMLKDCFALDSIKSNDLFLKKNVEVLRVDNKGLIVED